MRRSHPDVYEILPQAPLPARPEQIIAALSDRVTPARMSRFASVASKRRQGVIPVLEEIADPHNVAAILRSADAFGVSQLRVIPGEAGFFAASIVSKGSDRWLDLRRDTDARSCVEHLHSEGCRVVIATMDGRLTPADLATIPRVAIVFGNEHRGPSDAMRELADDTYAIPMVGFVESLNVSVAAAITLQAALQNRPAVDETTRLALQARFLLGSVRHASELVHHYLGQRSAQPPSTPPYAPGIE